MRADEVPRDRRIVPLLGINFVGTLGMSLVMPFLVILVEQFGGNGVIYGIMAAVYPAFQLVGSPILGRWSDRLGRKPVLLLSQAGTTLAWVLFYLALLPRAVPLLRVQSGALGSFAITIPLLLLFAARALDGVTGGNVSVANAYLSDISTPSTRSKNFGLLALSSNLGFIVGPTLAGLLGASALGVRLPVIAAFGISLIGLLLIGALLQEQPRRKGGPAEPGGSERDTPGVPDSPRQPRVHYCPQAGTTTLDDVEVVEGVAEPCESERGLSAILRIPNVSRFLILYFVLFLGFNIFYAVFPVHALRVYEWSSAELGIFFSTLSVLMVVVQGPLMGFLSGRVGEVPLVVGGSAASIVGLVTGGVFYEAIGSTTFALSAVAFLTAVIASLIMPSSPGTAHRFGASSGATTPSPSAPGSRTKADRLVQTARPGCPRPPSIAILAQCDAYSIGFHGHRCYCLQLFSQFFRCSRSHIWCRRRAGWLKDAPSHSSTSSMYYYISQASSWLSSSWCLERGQRRSESGYA